VFFDCVLCQIRTNFVASHWHLTRLEVRPPISLGILTLELDRDQVGYLYETEL